MNTFFNCCCKTMASALSIMMVAMPGLAQGQTIDSSYNNSHYQQRLAFFKQMPDQKQEIVFVGNSITEMGEWQELLPGKPVVNRGISGDVTYGILARMDEVLSSKPKKIFLLSGVNDLKRGIPVDSIIKTVRRIAAQVRTVSPKTKLYVESVLPVNEAILASTYKKVTNTLVQLLNQQLAALATEYNYTYVDLYTVMGDEKGQLKKELTSDGIHLWPAAYIIWIDHLKKQHCL